MIFVDMQEKKVPALGYGTWDLRGADCERAVAPPSFVRLPAKNPRARGDHGITPIP